MIPDDHWRELHRCGNLRQARMLATCIASMEYDVRLLDARGGEVDPGLELACNPPFVIQVPASHWHDLLDVLDAILEEQFEFDVSLAAWHDRASRWERRFLALLIAIVIVLATFGLIEL